MADTIKADKKAKKFIPEWKTRDHYNVEFLKDHGNNKKGTKAVMAASTANALANHEIVKVGTKAKLA